MIDIKTNLLDCQKRIQEACCRCGRDPNEVTLIAVSKNMPASDVLIAYQNGAAEFGENRVQELLKKHEELSSIQPVWHLIGHLQVNKVKYLPNKVRLIHSVESEKLAKELSRIGQKHDITFSILVEVNVAKEDTKYGIDPEETEEFIRKISCLSHLQICGLMTVAPYTDNPEENRPYFRKLRKIMVDLNEKNIDNIDMTVLSMGMSGDFEIAIEEGATMVRIGTGIFGERNYL